MMTTMPTDLTPRPVGQVIALLGAESTGKTTLSQALGEALADAGHSVTVVPEYLREFCIAMGRAPRADEQAGIAREQSHRIAVAAAGHSLVIADTTALMVAVYSEQVFCDTSLYDSAGAAQKRCALTLLTALDLPWIADGLMRDGPHVRQPVDTLLRQALARAKLPYSVVSGEGPVRLATALAAVRHRLAAAESVGTRPPSRWQWHCDRCGDAECERHLLPRLPSAPPAD